MRSEGILRSAVFGAILLWGIPEVAAQTVDHLLAIPWGTGLDQLRDQFGLEPLASDSASTRYTSRISRVEGVDVAECILEFRGTAFVGAAVLTRGRDNSRKFLDRLVRFFGPGVRENERAYQWFSDATHVSYDEDSEGDGYVYWYSRKLAASPRRTGR